MPLVVGIFGKGGVGKTTTAATIGHALSTSTRFAVQLLDLDAQRASLSSWLCPDLPDDAPAVEDVLAGTTRLLDVVHDLDDRLTLVPSTNGLAAVGPTLDAGALVRYVVDATPAHVLVVDTPAIRPLGPAEVLLRSVLAVADVVVIPFRTNGLDLDGLDETLRAVRAREALTGRAIPTLLLPTMTTTAGNGDDVILALRIGGLRVLPPAPRNAYATKSVGKRQLLAALAPAGNPLVTAYATAAREVAGILLRLAGTGFAVEGVQHGATR